MVVQVNNERCAAPPTPSTEAKFKEVALKGGGARSASFLDHDAMGGAANGRGGLERRPRVRLRNGVARGVHAMADVPDCAGARGGHRSVGVIIAASDGEGCAHKASQRAMLRPSARLIDELCRRDLAERACHRSALGEAGRRERQVRREQRVEAAPKAGDALHKREHLLPGVREPQPKLPASRLKVGLKPKATVGECYGHG
jgi:hypothetical protein